MSYRTPNYVLNSSHNWSYGPHDQKELPAGSFVRPMMIEYVPNHVIDRWKNFCANTEVFAYTKYGIIPIPKRLLREV